MERSEERIVFDRGRLLRRMGGDEGLLAEVLRLFVEQSPRMMSELGVAVRSSDSDEIMRAAHGIRGALQNISATCATEIAVRLEQLGRSGDPTGADDALASLETEIERLHGRLAGELT